MIPLDLLPGMSASHHPPDQREVRYGLRILALIALAALPAVYFWHDIFVAAAAFVVYVYLFLNFPVTAFPALAAIAFAVGWYIPLWPRKARLKAWQRASLFLAIVVVLHTGWFLFGWVTFHPLCLIKVGIGGSTGERALVGELHPAYADRFERALAGMWGQDAVLRSDANTVLVRPAVAAIDNEWNWNISYFVASGPLSTQLAGRKDADCIAMEQYAMLGGKADSWRVGWGLWPWNTINEDEGFARWVRSLYKAR